MDVDGTDAGTTLLMDINPGDADSHAGGMHLSGSHMLFTADDGADGFELWRTDGTTAGTSLVRDINPGSPSSIPSDFVDFNGLVYFSAKDGAKGDELWRTDGTTAGTVRVADINPGEASSHPGDLTVAGAWLYLTADDGVHGAELWRSDGTAEGTHLVKDIVAGDGGSFRYSTHWLTAGEDGLLFTAETPESGMELWTSDGTEGGTSMVSDIFPGSSGSFPASLVNVDDITFLTANDGVVGEELWRTDGTESGTVRLADSNPGPDAGQPQSLTAVGDDIVFTAAGLDGTELWASDGTSEGTGPVIDPKPCVICTGPTWLTLMGSTLYFVADDRRHGYELWRATADLPPVALDDSFTTTEDQPADVTVLQNDTDPEGRGLAVTHVGDPAHGTATVDADGTIRYVPNADHFGSDVFDYRVSDPAGHVATATVRLRITPVNDVPVVDAGPDQTIEWTSAGASTELDGTRSSDVDNESLSYTWSGGFVGNVALGPQPQVTFSNLGRYDVRLVVEDGSGATDTDTLTVDVVDTTAPNVDAALVPLEGGKFRVRLACADSCDANPALEGAINGVEVVDGTIVKLIRQKTGPQEVKHKKWGIKIKATSFELIGTCEDTSGNVGIARATPEFRTGGPKE